MNCSGWKTMMLCCSALLAAGKLCAAEMKVINKSVVSDKFADAQCPIGIAKAADGSIVAAFASAGDGAAQTHTYLTRTFDQGKSWKFPHHVWLFPDPCVGSMPGFTQLPDGRVICVTCDMTNTSPDGNLSRRHSVMRVGFMDADLKEFKFDTTLTVEAPAVLAPMPNNVIQLSNGDILIPAYCYRADKTPSDYPYGCGFFRSSDGGKTWGAFERAFIEPDPSNPLSFNESVIFETPDHKLVIFARIDSRPVKNMWKTVSTDFGKTWSKPVETDIPAVYPTGIRLKSGGYVMAAGSLKAQIPRTTTIFYSADGENFQSIGKPYYNRPASRKGAPYNTATGGSQAIFEVEPNKIMVTFYGSDPELKKGRNNCYCDSNLIEIIP